MGNHDGSSGLMRRALALLVAAAMGSGCAGVHIVSDPEVAPRHQLESGHRVRVHLFQPRSRVTGHVVRVNTDTLVISPDEGGPQEMTLATTNIRRLDLSRGKRSRAGRGALLGFLAGAVGGYVGLAAFCGDSGCIGAVALLAVIPAGALVGAGIGAGIGSQTRTERWQAVSWR